MAQEDKNVTIPPEMMQEIVRVASETAIEKFQHEAERNRKAVKDKRLHNTKLLLQNYHCFVEHSKSAVYEASQLSEDDDFEELMEELMSQSDGRVRVPVVRSIQESAAHTRIIVQHIDRMLEYYKFRCEHSKRAEEIRRYRAIYDLYIAPEPKTQQQIADEEHVDLSTVFRDQKAAISKLSALIFRWLDSNFGKVAKKLLLQCNYHCGKIRSVNRCVTPEKPRVAHPASYQAAKPKYFAPNAKPIDSGG